jgi:zinc transport system substrate-binding protein
MAAHFHESEQEEVHDEHEEHGTPDPHIWLSPTLVVRQLEVMTSALIEIFPEHRAFFSDNLKTLISSVNAVDEKIRQMLANSRGNQFMVFHPSWGYFARDYGLLQVPVEFEGKNPKPAQVRELIEHARNKNIKVIFAQPQFSQKSATTIAREIGGQVVIADPLALDWGKNLLDVADKIQRAAR